MKFTSRGLQQKRRAGLAGQQMDRLPKQADQNISKDYQIRK